MTYRIVFIVLEEIVAYMNERMEENRIIVECTIQASAVVKKRTRKGVR